MEWISRIEERAAEITQPEQIKKRDREWERRNVFNEDSLRELWDNIKDTDSHSIGVPEGEERRKGLDTIFEDIIAENFPNIGKERNIQIEEIQTVPNRINTKMTTLRHCNWNGKN